MKPRSYPLPAFPVLRPNPFHSVLPTSVLDILTGSVGSGAAPDAGASRAQRMVPGAAMDRAWAKCSVGRKGGWNSCHVTLQLCAPRQLELSSTPAAGAAGSAVSE